MILIGLTKLIFLITRDARRAGRACLKMGSLSFFFFFFMVASNLHINLFIKLSPLLVGMYCSDCLQQKRPNQNPLLGRGPPRPYLRDVKSSFDLFIKPGLNSSLLVGAILCTCFGLKYAVFKKKINPFEAVNRNNNFLEALNYRGGNHQGRGALYFTEASFALARRQMRRWRE